MQCRIDYARIAPDALQAMRALEAFVRTCGLEPGLLDLLRTRASQINRCAYCIHLHVREARARGESEDRLHLLTAWRDSPLYSERERAALAWTESVTLVAETHVPDDVFADARRHFSPTELVNLTMAVGMTNAWNRLAISMRALHPVVRSDWAPSVAERTCDERSR
jgi:AhpD family alkylhydroperoxidase